MFASVAIIPRSMSAIGTILVLSLFLSGCLAALTALVHFFLSRNGLWKALFGIAVNWLLGVYFILPACQVGLHRKQEIEWEKTTGVRQLQQQGVFYITNRAIPRAERVKAVELLTQAANYDYAPSQYSLGYCYKNGIGTATNRVLAWKWLTLAARQGSTKARGLLNQLQTEMSPEETAEAQRLVDEFAATQSKAR